MATAREACYVAVLSRLEDRMRSFASILMAVSLLAGCNGGAAPGGGTPGKDGATAKPGDIGETIATVNGTPIGSKEFEENASRRTSTSGGALTADEKKEVADRMVDDVLLYNEALKRDLDKDPKVKKVMVNTLLRDEVYGNVRSADFTDQELQTYFEAHKDEFIVPEKVQVKRILIKVGDARSDADAKKQADQVRADLVKNPDSFKDLAEKFSEDPYKRRGGDVGFVSKTGKPGLDQKVVDKAFELKNGDISEVFKTDEGYNIISIANRREEVERTFQQMKGSVLRKVKNDKLKELYDAYVAKLRAGAKIEMDDAKIQKMEVQGTKQPAGPGMTIGPNGAMRPGGGMPGMPGMPEKGGADEMDEDEGGEGGAEGGAPAAPVTVTPPPAPAPAPK
jgi:peptidyl-prolyl cis-trans isomerase C